MELIYKNKNLMKTKKFKEFVNMEVGLDLVKNEDEMKTIDLTKYKGINESKSPEELKKSSRNNWIRSYKKSIKKNWFNMKVITDIYIFKTSDDMI